MNCFFYFHDENSPELYKPLLHNEGLREIRFFRFLDFKSLSPNECSNLFIDDLVLLGNQLSEALENLNKIFTKGICLLVIEDGQIRRYNSFSDFNYSFLNQINRTIRRNHKRAIKEGQQLAKSNGKKLGRKKTIDNDKIKKLFDAGHSLRVISELTGYSLTSVWRSIKYHSK